MAGRQRMGRGERRIRVILRQSLLIVWSGPRPTLRFANVSCADLKIKLSRGKCTLTESFQEFRSSEHSQPFGYSNARLRRNYITTSLSDECERILHRKWARSRSERPRLSVPSSAISQPDSILPEGQPLALVKPDRKRETPVMGGLVKQGARCLKSPGRPRLAASPSMSPCLEKGHSFSNWARGRV